MATLEKIRSKSVLLLIIIGVALLAFIIGDFFNSSRTIFGPDSSVAKVGKEKIDFHEFQARSEAANRNGSGNSDEERAFLDEQVLQQLIMERLRDEEYDKLGLTVTDAELNDAVNGQNTAFADMLAYQYTGGQIASAQQLLDLTNNPAKYGYADENAEQMRQLWLNFEQTLSQQLLDRKFMSMLDGTMTTNKLDLAQLYADDNTGYMISYVSKPIVTDPSVKVEDKEIEALWEADKANYKLDEPTRLVNIITVPIVPSVDDENTAKALVAEVTKELNSTPDLEALRGRKLFDAQRTTLTTSAIAEAVKTGGNPALKSFVDSATVGKASVIMDGPTQFQIAKLLGRATEVDSVVVNIAIVQTSVADSVRTAIQAGAKAADLQKIEGVQFALDSIATSLTNPALNLPQVGDLMAQDFRAYKQQFINATLGTAFNPDTLSTGVEMVKLYTVTSRKAPQANVDIALISYNLEPSNATVDNLRQHLEDYLKANNNSTKFVDNAAASNYVSDFTDITASQPYVAVGRDRQGNPTFLPNSYAVALWALDAEPGQVSRIFGDERTGYFSAAALCGVFEEYRTTADPAVKSNLTTKARNQKTGDKMVESYKGKATDLAGYAQLFGTEVQESAVSLGSGSRVYGPQLVAQIATAPVGKLMGPAKGETTVVVYQVNSVNKPTRALNPQTDGALYGSRRGAEMFMRNAQLMYRLLLGDKKVENRLTKVIKRD